MIIAALVGGLAILWSGCTKRPIDSDGMLISTRNIAAMTNFDLLDEAHLSVKSGNITWDTVRDANGVLHSDVFITVYYGTNLKNLKPSCSVFTDCIVRPFMGVWTDFSDLANPRQYTVTSGNRKVSRIYTIHVSVAPYRL